MPHQNVRYKFVVDAQLPPHLAGRLRELGHEAEHVTEIGLGGATDKAIWDYVCARGAVLLTKDQDFAGLSNGGPEGTAVVWIRLGNTTNRALWRALEPVLPEILEALSRGERLIEVTSGTTAAGERDGLS